MEFLIACLLATIIGYGIASIPAIGPGCEPPLKNPKVMGECADEK